MMWIVQNSRAGFERRMMYALSRKMFSNYGVGIILDILLNRRTEEKYRTCRMEYLVSPGAAFHP